MTLVWGFTELFDKITARRKDKSVTDDKLGETKNGVWRPISPLEHNPQGWMV